jgi:indole-3-glycerol phosphate synthase
MRDSTKIILLISFLVLLICSYLTKSKIGFSLTISGEANVNTLVEINKYENLKLFILSSSASASAKLLQIDFLQNKINNLKNEK